MNDSPYSTENTVELLSLLNLLIQPSSIEIDFQIDRFNNPKMISELKTATVLNGYYFLLKEKQKRVDLIEK